VRLGVTTFIRWRDCPFQAMAYAGKIGGMKEAEPSVALVVGSLAHACFDAYYDITAEKRVDFSYVAERALQKYKKDYYYTSKRGQFLKQHKTEIMQQVGKYYRSFLKWARFQPAPWKREKIYTHGIVMGIVDRINKFPTFAGSTFQIIDYKTSSSRLSENRLEAYKSQLGGYIWLLNKSDPVEFPLEAFKPPSLVVLKKLHFEQYVLEDWELYVKAFDILVHTVASEIIKHTKYRSTYERRRGNHCIYCSVREQCQKVK